MKTAGNTVSVTAPTPTAMCAGLFCTCADVADRLVRQVGADRGGQMVLDVADRHPAEVDHVGAAPDLAIEPLKWKASTPATAAR